MLWDPLDVTCYIFLNTIYADELKPATKLRIKHKVRLPSTCHKRNAKF